MVNDWANKIQALNTEIKALRRRAWEMVGLGLDTIEECASHESIARVMKRAGTKFLIVHPVETSGAPCFVLSSTLYPEVGILIFDGDYDAGAVVALVNDQHRHHSTFKLVCGCCRPYRAGIGETAHAHEEWEKQVENLRTSFASEVVKACKKHVITHLVLQCYTDFVMPHEQDGLRLHWGELDGVDRWRFAAAFGEISIGGCAAPFDQLFQKQPK